MQSRMLGFAPSTSDCPSNGGERRSTDRSNPIVYRYKTEDGDQWVEMLPSPRQCRPWTYVPVQEDATQEGRDN